MSAPIEAAYNPFFKASLAGEHLDGLPLRFITDICCSTSTIILSRHLRRVIAAYVSHCDSLLEAAPQALRWRPDRIVQRTDGESKGFDPLRFCSQSRSRGLVIPYNHPLHRPSHSKRRTNMYNIHQITESVARQLGSLRSASASFCSNHTVRIATRHIRQLSRFRPEGFFALLRNSAVFLEVWVT